MAALRAAIARYMASETEHLLRHRLIDERLVRAGQEQVTILGELAGFPIGHPAIDRLTIPYMLLQAHYYLLDSAVDGEAIDADSLLSLTELLLLVTLLVEEELEFLPSAEARVEVRRRLASSLAERTNALRTEMERKRSWLPPDATDVAAAVGRSNSVLLFYDLLAALNGAAPDAEVRSALADLVYYLQLGDDLADWEDDLNAGNHTPLLRECLSRLGAEGPADHSAIERELFLGGFYEVYTARLVRNFDRIGARFGQITHLRSSKAQVYLGRASDKALTLLTDVVRAKLEHLGFDGPVVN